MARRWLICILSHLVLTGCPLPRPQAHAQPLDNPDLTELGWRFLIISLRTPNTALTLFISLGLTITAPSPCLPTHYPYPYPSPLSPTPHPPPPTQAPTMSATGLTNNHFLKLALPMVSATVRARPRAREKSKDGAMVVAMAWCYGYVLGQDYIRVHHFRLWLGPMLALQTPNTGPCTCPVPSLGLALGLALGLGLGY